MLHLFELLNKLTLQVYILILKLLLFVAVQSDCIIQLVHFLLQPLEVNFNLIYLSFEVLVVLVKTTLLLLHYSLLVFKICHGLTYLLKFVILVNQYCLLLDPLPVQLRAFLFEVFALS
jgi:hypothetical protein